MAEVLHRVSIRKLGPVRECEIEIKQFNVFTGPQSSGKSTIAKAIYYARSMKQDILNIMMQGGPAGYIGNKSERWLSTMQQFMRDKFLQIFGTSWIMPEDMELRYTFEEEKDIHVLLKEDKYNSGKNYIYIEFGNGIVEYFYELDRRTVPEPTAEQMEAERKILSRVLNDPYETVYIPAGRSLITLLSDQLNYIFLNNAQMRTIDYVTKKFIENILRIKPIFSHGMEGYLEEIKNAPELCRKYVENRPVINLLIDCVKKVVQGSYRYVDGEERLYLDEKKYVKISFVSSGQQEIVWVFNLLFYYLANDKRVFVILEEPESHLYPDSQRLTGEFLGAFLNSGRNAILVTTHSPYLLGTFNYMLQAGQCSRVTPAAERVKKVLRKRFWLVTDEVKAYFINGHKIENALDEEDAELILIRNELIDEASEKINEISDFIMEQIWDVEESDD